MFKSLFVAVLFVCAALASVPATAGAPCGDRYISNPRGGSNIIGPDCNRRYGRGYRRPNAHHRAHGARVRHSRPASRTVTHRREVHIRSKRIVRGTTALPAVTGTLPAINPELLRRNAMRVLGPVDLPKGVDYHFNVTGSPSKAPSGNCRVVKTAYSPDRAYIYTRRICIH